MDPITISLVMLTAVGGAIGSHYFVDNENKEHLLQAKKNAYKIEKRFDSFVKSDVNWKDKKGIDLLVGDDSSTFYPAVILDKSKKKQMFYQKKQVLYHLKTSKNEEITVEIKPVTENYMYAVINSKVENEEFNLLATYERVAIYKQIPILYANSGLINGIKYSSYSYDNLNKTLGCLAKPSILLAYTGKLKNYKPAFKIPTNPCGNNTQEIDAEYDYKVLLHNINYINTAYFQKDANVVNSNIGEIITPSNKINIDDKSYINKISTGVNYSFPKLVDNKENNNSKYNYLIGYQFDKECNFGEILHLGNGFLKTLKINKGCSAIVLEGDNYKIGKISVETGVNSEIKFSNDTVLTINTLSLKPQSHLYLTAIKNKDAHLRVNAEKINLGHMEKSFLGTVVEQENGKASLSCVHPGTCLYNTNYFSILGGSTVLGDIIVHKVMDIKNSQIIGTTYANTIREYNSNFSNIVMDNNEKVISDYYVKAFKKMAGNSVRTFLKPHKLVKCESEKECEKLAGK